MLPANHDAELARSVADYMKRLAAEAGRPEADEFYSSDIGKTGRDGELLASIAAAREGKRTSGSDSSIVLISSSGRLRRADNKFRNNLGLPKAGMSFKSFSYMLSLLQNVGLGVGSLRQALFDFGETATLTDVERVDLRVIKGGWQFDIPWARDGGVLNHNSMRL